MRQRFQHAPKWFPRPRHRPRHAARRTDRRRPFRRWRTALALLLSPLLGLGTFFVVGYAGTPMPTQPKDGVTDEGSPVYYADGVTPMFRLGANREVVAHEQIPDHVRWAVLAAEDRGFYDEPGVSPKGILRALVNNATGKQTQGGSTITQQLARNYYQGLSKDRTMRRKIREVFVALKIDRNKGKDEILDLYLNTVYFGRQASGVQAAARAFFHKDVWDVTVGEAALLAAMIQQPAYFRTQGDDPAARALRARWRYVLDGMVSMGRLTREQAARIPFPRTRREWNTPDESGQMLLVRERVMAELRELGVPMQDVLNGGLKIHTGLRRDWMEHAAEAMREAREPSWPDDVRAGLVAVDPATGAITALYGGAPERGLHDTVFSASTQVGSTFKPYALAAALRRGVPLWSTVDGRSPLKFAPDGRLTPMTAPGYRVDNDEKIGSVGRVDLVRATALSVNTGYVQLALNLGLDHVHRMARDLGIPGEHIDPFRRQAGIVLGAPAIPAVHQASAYAAFANGGTAVTPHLITRIVDGDGRPYRLPGRSPGRRVLTPRQAAQVTLALQEVVRRGTGRRAALPDRPAAGKTGTTDHNRAAWFVGYVPQLSAAVMMHHAEGATLEDLPGHRGVVSGDTLPSEIWASFMTKVTRGMPATR
ncbi:transglycosylase domain-containing protein [Thermomonospora amylolytica]|uniref:transglycosylase domain-containing protein n=1 Tax=Thermomonospora amylolytica TaxID=1411117 RepID=UPI000E6D528C|nr:transglycosylase domain-containing protein [Thermomonospora amylolytica]